MLEHVRRSAQPTELLDIIAQVRRRWRMKLALRGAVWVVAVALLLVARGDLRHRVGALERIVHPRRRASAWPSSCWPPCCWFIVRPLRRRVTDDQVALYLEEHEPSLQATLVSAVEASRTGHGESAALIRRVVEQAIAACQRANARAHGRIQAAPPLRRRRSPGPRWSPCWPCWSARRFIRQGLAAHVPDAAGPGRRALPHRGDARQFHRAQGVGSDRGRHAARVRRRRRQPDGAPHGRRQVRAAAAGAHRERRPTRGCSSTSTGRSTTSSRPTACARRPTR